MRSALLFSFKTLLAAIVLFLAPRDLQAYDKKLEERLVSGAITFDEVPKSDGKIYIVFSPEGGADNFAALASKPDNTSMGGATVSMPDIKIVALDESPSKEVSFQVKMTEGRYRVSCFVKVSSTPVCQEIQVNQKKVIGNCFPMGSDPMCSGEVSIQVDRSDVPGLKLLVGKEEQREKR